MKKSLIIYYFPIGMRYTSSLVFVLSIYLTFQFHLLTAALLIVIGISILSTKYVTLINKRDKVIFDYLLFLGLRLNQEKIPFNVIHHMTITKENQGYTANSRSRDRQVKWSQYNASIIYDHQQSFKLLSEMNKSKLKENIQELVQFLEVSVEDRTTNVPYIIKMEER